MVMKLMMPKDEGETTPVKCSSSLTLLLDQPNRIGWYECRGDSPSNLRFTTLDPSTGLRDVIIQKQNTVNQLMHDAKNLMIIIKPLDGVDYRTLVDVLDEMTINGVTRYAIADPEESDFKLLAVSR
jgi:hypothetical protein